MEEVYGVVYLIWNKINGKRYVGQTVQPLKERMRKHRYGNLYIDKAIDKYGLENFRYGVIKTCATKAKLDEAEKHFIVVLHSKAPYGYNLTDGGEGTVGYIPTPEHRARISAARLGENHPNYGKPLSDETCAKISAANRAYSPFKNLVRELDERHLSYSALARLMGVYYMTISKKMRGRVNFTERDKAKLVEIFGKPIEYLLARDD